MLKCFTQILRCVVGEVVTISNDSSLQLLCSSAAAKSFAALSVNLLRVRSNDSSLQLLCLSASAKSFAALSVKLLSLRFNHFSLRIPVNNKFFSLRLHPSLPTAFRDKSMYKTSSAFSKKCKTAATSIGASEHSLNSTALNLIFSILFCNTGCCFHR